MIIAQGKIYDSALQNEILAGLENEINHTLAHKTLPKEKVINAVSALSRRIAAGEFDKQIAELPIDGAGQYKELAIKLLSRENIQFKLRTELGADFAESYVNQPPFGFTKLKVRAMPLGVILHIAAGNADGLPAFSVAEGLLTGNVNILKLPQADNGLTVEIIRELINTEPALADFIYVFDTPSSDLPAIKKMADMADGIVVWGGDAAVSAVRKFAPMGTKLIEWGHKLSFSYISGYADKEKELAALAEHIIATKQLLCSSCQTIYIDTDSMEQVNDFCREFLPYLEKAAENHRPSDIGSVAEVTLLKYANRLEAAISGEKKENTFRSALCGLVPKEDSELELSELFGCCLVKRLPKKEILAVLRRKKGYLQTAGLICSPEKREELADILARSGVVRITGAGTMSDTFSGEAHDGEYPLRRYMRIVDEEVTTKT